MKKEYLFSYNIHPEYDYDEYKKAAVILDCAPIVTGMKR